MNEKEKILNYFLIFILLIVAYKVLQFFGIFKTEKELKYSEIVSGNIAKIFNPNYYKGKLKSINYEDAKYLAKLLYKSKGIFNDDEDAVYDVFRNLIYKSDVSYLSAVFSQMYKKDLLYFLNSFLSKNEMVMLYNILKNLI